MVFHSQRPSRFRPTARRCREPTFRWDLSILALRDGVPILALAQFNAGGFPADIEVTSALLDGKLPLVNAVTGPRVASIHPGKFQDGKPVVAIDPRYSRETLCGLAASLGSSAVLEADARGVLASEGSIDAITITRTRERRASKACRRRFFTGVRSVTSERSRRGALGRWKG